VGPREHHQLLGRGHVRVRCGAARRPLLACSALLALVCCCPAAALASTGNESVQLALTDPTHVSAKLTDADAMGTGPIQLITFNTTDGSLASVTLPGSTCMPTGVEDGQLCSPVMQLPGQTLQATLTLNTAQTARLRSPSRARSAVRAHASKSKEVKVCAQVLEEPFMCQEDELTGGVTPPEVKVTTPEVKDCDDLEIGLTGSRPYDISSYKGGRAYFTFTVKNVGNCGSSAGTIAVNGLGIFASYGAPLPSIAAGQASELVIGVTSLGVGKPGTVGSFNLELPADTDPRGESGVDPSASISKNLVLDPQVEMRIVSGAARASAAAVGSARHLQGTVSPGSRNAPDPVASTQVAVQMLGAPRGTCRWLAKGRIVSRPADKGKCDQPLWQNAPMTFKPKSVLTFRFRLPKALPHGRYDAIARATLKSGITDHTYPPGIASVRFAA
jgi:hypothetical protein